MKGRTSRGGRASRAMPLSLAALALAGCSEALAPAAESRPAECREPAGAAVSTSRSADSLFRWVDAPALSGEQRRLLDQVRSQPTTARIHVARLVEHADSLLRSDREITFNVSPTRSFTATGKGLERPDYLFWSGRMVGGHGEVSLVLTSSGITGGLTSISGPGASAAYSFQPLGGGLQAVVCVDPGKYPPD